MKRIEEPLQLRGLDFTFEEMKESRKRNGLLRIGIAIGNGGKKRKCNAKCPYCFEEREYVLERFSFNEIQWILTQGTDLGIKTAVIIGYGEPLMPSRWEETRRVIAEINDRNLTPVIFTNGLVFPQEVADELYRLNASVITTVNSFDPETQDYMSGVKDALSKKLQTLQVLKDTGFTSSPVTRAGLESVITKTNLKDIINLADYCVENDFYPYFESMKYLGEARKNPQLQITAREQRDVFKSIVEKYPNFFGTEDLVVPPQGRPCLQHYYGSLYVTPAGIFLCSGLPLKIGDMRCGLSSLYDAVEHNFTYQIRHLPKFLEGKCGECSLFGEREDSPPLCWGGCRANAYHYANEEAKNPDL